MESLTSPHSPSLTTQCFGCCQALRTRTGEQQVAEVFPEQPALHLNKSDPLTQTVPKNGVPLRSKSCCAEMLRCACCGALAAVLVAASCMARSCRLPSMPTPSTCVWTSHSAWSSRTRREGQSMCRYDIS